MKSKEELRQNFTQSHDSCVLTAYAIAAYNYIEIDIYQYFVAFCAHFGFRTDRANGECAYSALFHREWNRQNVAGNKLICDLHNESKIPEFQAARQRFSVYYIPNAKKDITRLLISLKSPETLISLTENLEGGGTPSMVWLKEGPDCINIETRPDKSDIFPRYTMYQFIETINAKGGDAIIFSTTSGL